MITSSFPSNNANAVAPYAPLGRQLVGQENPDLKISSLKALEQPAASARQSPDSRKDEPQVAIQTTQANTSGADKKAAQKEQLVKDQAKISALSARDREVRAHEQAHAAVGGQYAGAPTYEFVKGPDGVNYAVGGEVSINTGSVTNDPAKAQQIRAAANAPADPSGQDRSVAAAAVKLEADARTELNAQKNAEVQQKEKLAEEQTKTQKSEEAKKNEREEQYRNEQKQELAQRQEDAVRRSAERVDSFAKANSKTINISRRLVEIGVVKGLPSVGSLLNHRV